LHVAVRTRQLDVMGILLQCDEDRISKQQPDNDVVSSDAADNRSVNPNKPLRLSPVNLRPLSQQSCLIDCQNYKGETVLHYVVTTGSLELVSELLKWKPNLELESSSLSNKNSCLTALDMAACQIAGSDMSGEKWDILRCLIEHPNGYGPEFFMLYRVRALCCAIDQKDYNLTLIEYLSNVTDLRIRNHDGDTALQVANFNYFCGGDIISVLLRSPSAAEAVNVRSARGGRTILQDAITFHRNYDTVLAIAKMANVNLPDDNGKTPLHYAVAASLINNVQLLLSCQADVSIRDHDGNTAFVMACSGVVNKWRLSIIYELLRHGIAYGELSNMV